MEFEDTYIKITDETILAFYRENKNLDFVAMNHIFIDILKSLSSNLSNTINSTINSKVLSMVTDIHTNFKSDIIIFLIFFLKLNDFLAKFDTLHDKSSLNI